MKEQFVNVSVNRVHIELKNKIYKLNKIVSIWARSQILTMCCS